MGIVFLAITGLVSYSEFVPRLILACVVAGVVVVLVVVVVGPAPAIADAIDICVSRFNPNPAFWSAEDLF